MGRYPHQLSGGMAQRVVIAMALAAEPALLILDEPTTALDATVEAEVLDLVSALRAEFDTSVLFISHNLAVIAKMCDRVGVLYAGELVEEGPAREVFDNPRHPYTVGLLRCIPRRGQRKDHGRLDTIPGFLPPAGHSLTGCVFAPRCLLAEDRCREAPPPSFQVGAGRTARCYRHDVAPSLPRATPEDKPLPGPAAGAETLVQLAGLSKTFGARGSRGEQVHALTGVDLELERGETLGLVGESGSGKTTLARVLLGLLPPDPGAADRVPEPGLGAQPAAYGAAADQPPADPAGGPVRRTATGPAGRADCLGPARGPPSGDAPQSAVRRPQAAGGDRPGVRQRSRRRGL
jgi:peptide/nickel transport system ATP-binding protein